MGLSGLLPTIQELPDFQEVQSAARRGVREQLVSGIGGSLKTAFVAALFQEKPQGMLYLTYNPLQAAIAVEDLESFLG